MKRMMSMMCMAATLAVAGVAAQSGTTPPGTTPPGQADKKMAPAVTVTGCVAPGASTGQYMLTNATSSMADKAKSTMPTEKSTMPAAKGAGDHMMSYNLMGGSDLKPHLGHKVEVTGTVTPAMGHDKAAPETMDKSKAMSGGTLTVTNVKMISATCP